MRTGTLTTALVASIAAASPALAEKGPEVLNDFPVEAEPAIALPYENPGVSTNTAIHTGEWALTGTMTSPDKTSVIARAHGDIPTEELKAWGCKDEAMRGQPADASILPSSNATQTRKLRVKGSSTYSFFTRIPEVRFYNGAGDNGDCNERGSRSVDVRVEQNTKKEGQWVRNSAWANILKNTNEGYNRAVGKEKYTDIPLFKPYKCIPGEKERRFRVAFRIRSNYSPLPPEASNVPSQKIYRIKDSRVNPRFKKYC